MNSPKEINDHLRVTAVPTYLLAAAIILMLGAFIVWGFLGTVSDKAYYSGVVFPVQGTTDITLPNKGMVRSMLVHNGDSVHEGQTVALVSIGDSYSFLTSTVDGLVISTKTDNEPFEAFDPIVAVVEESGIRSQKTGTQLIAYADNEAQRDLRIGMEAQVWPADEVRQTLKSNILAKRLLEQGDVVYEVRIDLLHSSEDSTRYDWSFGEPADVRMDIGTYCSVLSETKRRSMFEYLFESARTRFRNLKQKLD